jgi:DNA-directed RNA polymerase subunit E'/Rpb7
MERSVFIEKKLYISPKEFNLLKTKSIDDLLLTKAKEQCEGKCSQNGFIIPNSITKLISRSMGYFEAARFTGDAIYYVKIEARVIYPADGITVIGKVLRKNKMGLYVEYKNAIRIQVPRDLHIGNIEFDRVELGDLIKVEIKRSKFAINDTFILSSGIYVETVDKEESESDSDLESDSEFKTPELDVPEDKDELSSLESLELKSKQNLPSESPDDLSSLESNGPTLVLKSKQKLPLESPDDLSSLEPESPDDLSSLEPESNSNTSSVESNTSSIESNTSSNNDSK